MRITYDAQPLVTQHKTGIEYVIINILDTLLETEQYKLILQFFSKGKTEEELSTVRSYSVNGIEISECSWFRSKVYNALWMIFPIPYDWFFTVETDIIHFQSNYTPPGVKYPTVTTIHDILPLVHPEWVRIRTKIRAKLSTKASCHRADHIITDSVFSKSEIVHHCGIAPEKITVIPCGVDFKRFNSEKNERVINTTKSYYRIQSNYLLYIGGIVPHKNLEHLLIAYRQAYKKNPSLPVLVIGGTGWQINSLIRKVKKWSDMEKNAIKFIGYVKDEHVPALLKGARAFLFPSLYEGFGMPPLEAMACGTPVIVSNAASLPEIVGDAGILIDPKDIDKWEEAITKIIEDDDLYRLLSKKGIKHVKSYTWEHASEKISNVYRILMEKKI